MCVRVYGRSTDTGRYRRRGGLPPENAANRHRRELAERACFCSNLRHIRTRCSAGTGRDGWCWALLIGRGKRERLRFLMRQNRYTQCDDGTGAANRKAADVRWGWRKLQAPGVATLLQPFMVRTRRQAKRCASASRHSTYLSPALEPLQPADFCPAMPTASHERIFSTI